MQGFEETKLPDDHFDVVIGNVPFGDFKVNDSRYNAQKFLIHDYFFAKALDKVRAGGVVAFITSKVLKILKPVFWKQWPFRML